MVATTAEHGLALQAFEKHAGWEVCLLLPWTDVIAESVEPLIMGRLRLVQAGQHVCGIMSYVEPLQAVWVHTVCTS